MGQRGPEPETLPGTNEPRIHRTVIGVYRDHWPLFQERCADRGMSAAARIRELIAEDIERGQ